MEQLVRKFGRSDRLPWGFRTCHLPDHRRCLQRDRVRHQSRFHWSSCIGFCCTSPAFRCFPRWNSAPSSPKSSARDRLLCCNAALRCHRLAFLRMKRGGRRGIATPRVASAAISPLVLPDRSETVPSEQEEDQLAGSSSGKSNRNEKIPLSLRIPSKLSSKDQTTKILEKNLNWQPVTISSKTSASMTNLKPQNSYPAR